MDNIFITITLIILGIAGVRDIIAFTGIIPIDTKFSWLIYGKYDEQIIQRVLTNLGYTKIERKRIIAGMTKRERGVLTAQNPIDCCNMLIDVIRNCIIKTGDMIYGSTATKYYIHTMMGSQNEDFLKTMSDLFIYMILYNAKNRKLPMPDYIIVPKNGNPLLGKYIADKLGIKYILHKSSNEKSFAKTQGNYTNKFELDFQINYEGAYYLDKNKKLSGIVLDCNTSGGTQLLNAADEFNDLIEQLKLKFEPIKSIYTLFKVDDIIHNNKKIDENFNTKGYKLYRYFDLDEDIKQIIYDSNSDSNDHIIDVMKNKNSLKINDFE